MPQKKYIVRLTAQEREDCRETVRKLNGSSEKVRRAQVLLKADADGARVDRPEDRQRLFMPHQDRREHSPTMRAGRVRAGAGAKTAGVPPVPKLLNGEQEAHIIALRLGPPPKGYANWSLRLLARRVVELAIIESISHETIRRTLKKTG